MTMDFEMMVFTTFLSTTDWFKFIANLEVMEITGWLVVNVAVVLFSIIAKVLQI